MINYYLQTIDLMRLKPPLIHVIGLTNVNSNARGQCFGIGNMAAMVTRWLQRHRPMPDPVIIQNSDRTWYFVITGSY